MTATISKGEDLKPVLKPLEDAFNMRLPRARLEALLDELKGKNPQHIRNAVKYLINNKPYMPINSDIIIATQVEAEKDWKEKKAEERRQAPTALSPEKQKTNFGKEAAILAQKVSDPDISKEERIRLMREMHRKYPILKLHQRDKEEDYTDYSREADRLERQWGLKRMAQ